MKRSLFLLLAVLASTGAEASSKGAYCAKIDQGESEPVHEVCKEGDIIQVTGSQVMTYCDFEAQIIDSPDGSQSYICQYVGYNRKLRSRIDGKVSKWVVKDE